MFDVVIENGGGYSITARDPSMITLWNPEHSYADNYAIVKRAVIKNVSILNSGKKLDVII